MAILLTLLTFLLFISITYFRSHRQEAAAATAAPLEFVPSVPRIDQEKGFDIPRGYCFHPGHTWVLEEGQQQARVGLDAFGAELLGKVDRIETGSLYRWVRQGERLWTVMSNGHAVDMLSPIEGVVMAENPTVLRDPGILSRDPYGEGWILVVKSPDMESNLNNLMRGPLVRVWMQEAAERLKEFISGNGKTALAFAQDGGLPVAGSLARVEPELRERLVKEFFLTSAEER